MGLRYKFHKAFLKDKGCIEDGNPSNRIVDLILKVVEDAKKEESSK